MFNNLIRFGAMTHLRSSKYQSISLASSASNIYTNGTTKVGAQNTAYLGADEKIMLVGTKNSSGYPIIRVIDLATSSSYDCQMDSSTQAYSINSGVCISIEIIDSNYGIFVFQNQYENPVKRQRTYGIIFEYNDTLSLSSVIESVGSRTTIQLGNDHNASQFGGLSNVFVLSSSLVAVNIVSLSDVGGYARLLSLRVPINLSTKTVSAYSGAVTLASWRSSYNVFFDICSGWIIVYSSSSEVHVLFGNQTRLGSDPQSHRLEFLTTGTTITHTSSHLYGAHYYKGEGDYSDKFIRIISDYRNSYYTSISVGTISSNGSTSIGSSYLDTSYSSNDQYYYNLILTNAIYVGYGQFLVVICCDGYDGDLTKAYLFDYDTCSVLSTCPYQVGSSSSRSIPVFYSEDQIAFVYGYLTTTLKKAIINLNK